MTTSFVRLILHNPLCTVSRSLALARRCSNNWPAARGLAQDVVTRVFSCPVPRMKMVPVTFTVHADKIHPWEFVFVVGSHPLLGDWDPERALELSEKNEKDVWTGAISLDPADCREPLRFRYFIGYYLQANADSSSKARIISRWESQLLPRFHLFDVHNGNNNVADQFGFYNGKQRLSNGWLHHDNQVELLIRLHGNAFKFFKERYNRRTYFVKVVAFDLRHKEVGSIDDECDETSDGPNLLPALPSFSNTEVASLYGEDPYFHDQPPHGQMFRNDNGYIIFKTSTIAVEFLAFRIELYIDHTLKEAEAKRHSSEKKMVVVNGSAEEPSSSSSTNYSEEVERVAIAYCMPSSMQDTFGLISVPIIAKNQQPIGLLNLDYLFVKAMPRSHPISLEVSYARHWKKRAPLEVGHRGMGNSYTKFAAARENTIHSLNKATLNGADFVEFDVQLTKDKTAVVFHDFHVLVSVAKRGSALDLRPERDDDINYHELAVKDLRLQQLQLLHVSHHKAIEHKDKLKVTAETNESNEYQSFPTLVDALRSVVMDAGFNIEIKYPLKMKDGSHECENYFERNMYIDVILKDVLMHAGSRRIVFSSFDPDICSIIALKQNKYPILFLCVGETARYVPFLDQRTCTSDMAVNFAASQSILGINFHSEDLLRNHSPVQKARDMGLVSFVWGDDLDDRANVEFMRKLNVDGIIYDRIGEMETRRNIFTVERDAKNALFPSSSPAPSRSGSLDKSTASNANASLFSADPTARRSPSSGRDSTCSSPLRARSHEI